MGDFFWRRYTLGSPAAEREEEEEEGEEEEAGESMAGSVEPAVVGGIASSEIFRAVGLIGEQETCPFLSLGDTF